MATDTAASNGTRPKRALNFANFLTEKVTLTARSGREFALRDDVPASTLLSVRFLPSLDERWQEQTAAILADMEEEAKAAESAGDDHAAAATLSASQSIAAQRASLERQVSFQAGVRAQLLAVRRGYEEDVLSVVGDVFRWTYPELTDAELFGAWNEKKASHTGGIFSIEEAEQILELFTALRGLAFSPLPSATEPQTLQSATPSVPPLPNRATRRAAQRTASTSPSATIQ